MIFAEVLAPPEAASTVASRVDALFWYVTLVGLGVAALVGLVVIVFALRFRRRHPDERGHAIEGSNRLELAWTILPFLIFLTFFFWSASLFSDITRPPDGCLEVYVVGKQWMWKLQHPDGQREINTLHVPVGRPVKLIMTSEDVIHSFFVPAFRIKQDVLPGRYTYTWFEVTKPGTYHLFCAEFCGTDHSGMVGQVIALEPAEYQAWLANRAEGSLALEGRKRFLKLQCVTCHSADAQARAPNLEELFGSRVALQDGRSVIADESYLRRSILRPREQVVAGWQPIMPTYEGQVNEEELIELIAFIKSLKRGQTPVRTEEAAPPAVRTEGGSPKP